MENVSMCRCTANETPRNEQIVSRNNQHYALNCTTPLFSVLAPTCFGSSLPSSGSFLDPSEVVEIQIGRLYPQEIVLLLISVRV
jgi:hypothetical protein